MSNALPDIQGLVMAAAEPQIRAAAEDYGLMLKDYIRYEYEISNMELASSWHKHGYDFKMMPESFIEHIQISPVAIAGDRCSMDITIEPESFAG